ncbi:MAG: cytochrome c family protein [Candidatus Hydrogenedentota bacterium]|nr:MAG: cytochrome c family protein [Candidatus Hydrogenedentota bacterium]
MKGFSLVLTILFAVVLAGLFSAPATAEHNYVGVKGCKMCHMSPAKGAQYKLWEESKHSRAYSDLASDKAKEVASAKGIGNPQESPECLKCHVTGYGSDPSMFEATYTKEEGVGCESCHGPGKDYKNVKIMKDVEQAKANGLIIPTEETCKKCHNPESPTFKGFNFEERKAEIAHPRPQKGE